jgi:hypothetical protein
VRDLEKSVKHRVFCIAQDPSPLAPLPEGEGNLVRLSNYLLMLFQKIAL